MTTIPNGAPAWVRSSDYTTYGGHLNKRNYQDEPIVNPRTDVGANAIQRMGADLAAVARMAPFCNVTFTANAAGSSISVTACRLMTGSISTAYAGTSPPAGFPTITHLTGKSYQIAIGGSYTDEYGVAGTFAPAFAGGSCTSYLAADAAYASGVNVVVTTGTGTGTHSVWIA